MKQALFLIAAMTGLLTLGGASLCAAQEGSAGPKLELFANKRSFVLFEPIVLRFRITTQAEHPLPGQTTEAPRYGRLYAVASGGGRSEELPGFSLNPNSRILTDAIASGSVKELQLVFVPSERKKLLRAAKYQIKAILDVRPGIHAVSDFLTIEVAEPSGLDLEAVSYMRVKGLPEYFFEGNLTIPEGRDQREVFAKATANLEEFVARFPGTAYGDYAALTLGNLYSFHGQYTLAINTLERLVDEDQFARLDSVLATLAAAEVKLDNIAKGKEYLAMLQAKCPNSELIKSTAEFVETGGHPPRRVYSMP